MHSIGAESVVFRVRGDETILWELPRLGTEVLITLLERDTQAKPEYKPDYKPDPDSREFLYPGDGVSLSAVCRINQCLASTTNNGLVVIRVGQVESRTYRELVTNQSCSCCNYPLEAGCFHGVIFNSCQGEVEIAGNVRRFNAEKMPKLCKIELSDGTAIVRMRRTIADTDGDTAPKVTPETVRPEHVRPSSPSPSPSKKTETPSMLDQILEQVMRKHHLANTPGLNLIAKCSNFGCGSNKEGTGVIFILIGSANSLRYKETILGQTCPSCHQPIPLTSFKGIAFFQCKAKVVINGEETEYVAGRIPEMCGLSLEGAEVEITVLERRVGAASAGKESPKGQRLKPSKGNIGHSDKHDRTFTRACIGLNLEAMCMNPSCEASIVVIPCPKITECEYATLLNDLTCPGCQCVIPPICCIGITLVKCKAEVRIGNEKHIVTAEGDETVDFKVDVQGSEVYVKILHRNIYSSGELSGGIGKEYLSSCTGLNCVVICENPDCLAFKENSGIVTVNFQDISAGVLREVASSMMCPACIQHLPFASIKEVVFVRCSGQIQIGSENLTFNSLGSKTSDFLVFPDGPQVTFDITKTDSIRDVLVPEKGLNLLARCSNASCPSQSQPILEGIVRLKIGEVTDCRLQRLIQGKLCPLCYHTLHPSDFKSTAYTQCAARVQTLGLVVSYLLGQSVESVNIGLSKDPVVDILPIRTKNIALEPYGSPYKQMKRGMNLKVVCSNLDCPSKKSSDGFVIISLPEMKLYTFKDLYSTVRCPSCDGMLSRMILLTLSFIHCRAEMLVGKDRFILKAASGEVIDFKPDSSVSDVKIHVMEEEADTSLLFPDGQTEGSTSKGATLSHHSVCHGLNFKIDCSNPTCEAVKASEYVMIESGHLIDCNLRIPMQLLHCSSCEDKIYPNQVKNVTFLCCSGEITIHGKKDKFNPTGQATADFKIPNDSSPVIVKVFSREYNIVQNPALGFLQKQYTKHHNGINFHCYCNNLPCVAVRDNSGIVIVQRDDIFVNKHGYKPSTCYFSQEISHLNCTACGFPLRKYYVWGVGLLHCRGTITRDGSLVEHFSPSMGRVQQYALDTGDTSLRIEFQLI